MSSMQGWAFQPPGDCSWCVPPSFLPDNTPDPRQLFSIHFYLLLPPSLNHQGAITRSLERCLFPSASAVLMHAKGCCRGAAAPRLSHITACREPLSSLRVRRVMASPPRHGVAHQGVPGAHGLSPALSHPPGKRCGKCWLLLLNKLFRGLLRFNQSLVIHGVLSRCSDPLPLLDLRAGAQASPPGPTQQVSLPFPQQTVPLFPSAIHHGKARDLQALTNSALLQNSFPFLLPTPPPHSSAG